MATDFWSVSFGAILGFLASLGTWKLQHRDMVRDSREAETHREKVRTVEDVRDRGGRLVEMLDIGLNGPHIDRAQLTTLTYMEIQRLKRDFETLLPLVSELFPNERERLTDFNKKVSEVLFRNPTPDRIASLRREFDSLYRDLRNRLA